MLPAVLLVTTTTTTTTADVESADLMTVFNNMGEEGAEGAEEESLRMNHCDS